MDGVALSFGFANAKAFNLQEAIGEHGLGAVIQAVDTQLEAYGLTAVQAFGRQEAASAFLALTNDQLVTYNENLRQLNMAAGASDEALARVNEGLGAQWDLLTNRLDNALTEVGLHAMPVLTDALKALNVELDRVNTLAGRVQGFLKDISGGRIGAGDGGFDIGGGLLAGARFAANAAGVRFANGGIVTGPRLALLGEQGPEQVTRLDGRGHQGGRTINVYNYGSVVTQQDLVRDLKRAESLGY